MTAEPLVTLENVAVGYGRHVVLSGLHFELNRRSFTGLLGANGSGKTTLIKTLLGILPPLGARLVFHPLGEREPVLGYVPQAEKLDSIFLLSSLEVVLMGAYGRIGPGRRVSKDERNWAWACLEQTGAADLAREQFSRLSGGQKQRVLIARALVTRPDFLLLDEPIAGVDAAAARVILELLDRLHQEGMTLLLVSHDLPAMRRHAERILWLRGGRVEQGTAREMLSPEKIEELFELKPT